MKRKNLGRGLDAILGEVSEAYDKATEFDENRIVELDIEAIRPNPHQPRKEFDPESLKELADSIRRHGLLQPVVVIEDLDGFVLIAGERRLRASKMAGFEKIKAIVAEIEPSRFREMALIENIQREDLSPLELAESYRELIEDYSITHEELASIVNKSRAHITNTLRLLNLADYAKEALAAGKITAGHAKALAGLDPERQRVLVDSITGQKLSVRETEKLVKKEKKTEKKVEKLDTEPLKRALKDSGLKFRVKGNRLTIEFGSDEEIGYFIERFLRKSY